MTHQRGGNRVVLGTAVLLIAAAAWALIAYGAQPDRGRNNERSDDVLWLSNFIGNDVVVTFLTPPPGMEHNVRPRLIEAEVPGVVLGIANQNIFFPYSNISSIEKRR